MTDGKTDIDKMICADCLAYMKTMPEESVDLVVTSPPYAQQRKKAYGGIDENDFPLWFLDNDTYIWNKTNPFPTGSKKRLKDGFEYCFLFTKTKEYKFYPNNVLVKSTSKYLESEKRRKNNGSHDVSNGSGMNMSRRYVSDMVRPSNVISFPTDTTNHSHPATFPLALPDFFIRLLTEEGDLVYDPFAGSGTTLRAAENLGRHYLGTDITIWE